MVRFSDLYLATCISSEYKQLLPLVQKWVVNGCGYYLLSEGVVVVLASQMLTPELIS